MKNSQLPLLMNNYLGKSEIILLDISQFFAFYLSTCIFLRTLRNEIQTASWSR